MKLKNDKERSAFLEDYRNKDNGWYLWKEDGEISRRMWRYDFPDCALIVEEQLITYNWPNDHITWSVVHWYIVRDWHQPFADSQASMSLARQEVKKHGEV